MKAGAGHQHHAANSGRCRRAARFGDALDRQRGGLGFAGAAFEFDCGRNIGIEQIEIGELAREQRGIGKANIVVIGRHARHRDRALGEPRHAVTADVVGGDHRLALAHEHAQADVVAFRSLGFLDTAVAHFDPLRNAAHGDRIGCVRAGAPGGFDKALRQRRQGGLIEQLGGGGVGGKRRCTRW